MLYAVRGRFVKGVMRPLMASAPLNRHSERVRVTAHLAGGDPHGEYKRVRGRAPIVSGGHAFLAGVNAPVWRHRPGDSSCLRGLPLRVWCSRSSERRDPCLVPPCPSLVTAIDQPAAACAGIAGRRWGPAAFSPARTCAVIRAGPRPKRTYVVGDADQATGKALRGGAFPEERHTWDAHWFDLTQHRGDHGRPQAAASCSLRPCSRIAPWSTR